MQFNSELLTRVIHTLRSPARVQRIVHFIQATALFALPDSLRAKIFKGNRHYCPVCQSHLLTFLVLHRPYHLWCPVCKSLQRHRLVWLFFQQKTNLFSADPKRMLHIAPESAFVPRLLKLKHLDYITADLYDPNVMVKMDITDIQYPSNSFDIIYCSHVLEHVADDRAAMREMHRVLKPTGWAVILVPVTAAVTVEETFSNNPSQREKQFGQHDHVRRYGYDFVNRLEDANFKVSQHDWQDVITKDELEYLGIPNGEIIYFCKKA